MSAPKKWALIGICVVLVISVCARAFVSEREPEPQKVAVGASSVGGSSLVDGGEQPVPGEPGAEPQAESEAAKALPYVTEGSFFALIGFALGYASRKFVKIGLVFLAIFFVGLQVLAYMNVVSIDWGRGIELVNKFVLNIHEGDTVKKVITDKLPTAGALTGGYFLGFRKG